jgi:hypothetical protein
MMSIRIDDELLAIMRSIKQQALSQGKWAEQESDDEFQTNHYCGGYDADEKSFCFSWYDSNHKEYWFQFSLDEIEEVLAGNINELEGRVAE